MADDRERDMCDLDPTKICDNCCRCISADGEYNSVDVLDFTDRIATLEEMAELTLDSFDDCVYDPDSIDHSHVAPLDIDPALVAEWERRLRIAELEQAQLKASGLTAQRKKKKD